jgi:transposase
MKKDIIKMFNLQGLILDKMEVQELKDKNKVVLHCRSPRVYASCPQCGKPSKKVHQYKKRTINHSTANGQNVFLNLRIRRFECRKCTKVFTEKIPGINKEKSSNNFKKEMLTWLQRNSFNYISGVFDISPATLNRYVLDIYNNHKINWEELNTTRLGLDEHSFRKRGLVGTITDMDNRKLLSILETDRIKDIESYFNNIPEKQRNNIEEVCIDLKWGYKLLIERCFKNAKVVADRFHVEQLVKRSLDEIRTVIQDEARGSRGHLKKLLLTNYDLLSYHEQAKLDMIWKKYEKWPVLKQAWLVKEKIIDFYRSDNYSEAEKKMKHILMLLETSDYSHYLSVLAKTLRRWKNPILNYFISRTTNGFTEGCHTKIKLMKRVSYGFRNIDNYIAKMMLSFIPLFWIINHHTV